MNILDEFLNEHQITRYRLSKITGISNQLLLQYTKKTLEEYPVWLLRALAAATDQTIEEVLNKLE
ncbi:helix-turn-helix domain-containing protein, partial [Listeria monocytogenes]|nr:helix-turn-helix domain-containing protein [Listeria monocytogenes]